MIRWPSRAARAIAALFGSLQNVDVYVEDQGDEHFYTVLFGAAAPPGVEIRRVIGLGGRNAVLLAAQHYPGGRPAVFVIDGDFSWVRGEPPPALERLIRLNAYCVENILIADTAIHAICCEEGMCGEADAKAKFGLDSWLHAVGSLIPVFERFAVLNQIDPGTPTVSIAFSAVVEADSVGLPQLSKAKVDSLIASLDSRIIAVIGSKAAKERLEIIENRIAQLPRPLRVVSGKDLLLPLLFFHMKRIWKTGLTKSVFRYRLATKCRPIDLVELTAALQAAS